MLVHFRVSCVTRGADVGDEPYTLRDPKTDIEVTMQRRNESARNYEGGDEICTASCSRDIPAEVVEAGMLADTDEVVSQIEEELYGLIARLVHVVRWYRGAADRQHKPIRFIDHLEWSLDGDTWKPVKKQLSLSINVGIPQQQWSKRVAEAITALVLTDASEPLGHELFREAYAIAMASPRSAVVLAVAAAEIGFKEFAATLAPETDWLLENLQSPDLDKMLSKWLPQLRVRRRIDGAAPFVPPALRKRLRNGVDLRNKLVHRRVPDFDTGRTSEVLQAVYDFLYLLDIYAGSDWAALNISPETRNELVKEAEHRRSLATAAGRSSPDGGSDH